VGLVGTQEPSVGRHFEFVSRGLSIRAWVVGLLPVVLMTGACSAEKPVINERPEIQAYLLRDMQMFFDPTIDVDEVRANTRPSCRTVLSSRTMK